MRLGAESFWRFTHHSFLPALEHAAEPRRHNRMIWVTDSTFDSVSIQVWRQSAQLGSIIQKSQEIAKKCGGLKFSKYLRVVIVSQPNRIVWDPAYKACLQELFELHKRVEMGLGVCLVRSIPWVNPHFHNIYVVPGLFVGIYDIYTQLALEFSNSQNRKTVEEFTNLQHTIIKVCNERLFGSWMAKEMTFEDFSRAFKELANTLS